MHLEASRLANWVLGYLGRGNTARDQAEQHTNAAIMFVRGYTRGVGFTPVVGGETINDELAAVVVTVAARSLANPANISSETTGPFSVSRFQVGDFTLAERAVLDRYRVKAR